MAKKNPYTFTIGFNPKDPAHVKVADILNNIGRGKAQLIVNAVLAYRMMDYGGQIMAAGMETHQLRALIYEILEKHQLFKTASSYLGWSDIKQESEKTREKERTYGISESIESDVAEDILASLKSFRS